jgi:hypothetical protein
MEWEFVMEAKHTLTPWRVIDNEPGNGYGSMDVAPLLIEGEFYAIAAVIGDVIEIAPQANADFIVRACNSHDALVEALSAVVRHGLVPPKGEYKFAQEKYLGDLCHAALALAGETP